MKGADIVVDGEVFEKDAAGQMIRVEEDEADIRNTRTKMADTESGEVDSGRVQTAVDTEESRWRGLALRKGQNGQAVRPNSRNGPDLSIGQRAE